MASHDLNGSAVNLAKAFQNVIVEAIASIRADNLGPRYIVAHEALAHKQHRWSTCRDALACKVT